MAARCVRLTGPQIDRLLDAADDHGQFLADNEQHADLATLERAAARLAKARAEMLPGS